MAMRRDTVPAERWSPEDDLNEADLVQQLESRLGNMRRGNIMEVVVCDDVSPGLISAWCKENGHLLVWSKPPKYWIEPKS